MDDWFSAVIVPADQSIELVRAQIDALKRRMPILYVVLTVNTFFMSVVNFERLPVLLDVFAPLALLPIMLVRLRYWWTLDIKALSHQASRRLIVNTTLLAGLLSVMILVWALAIYVSVAAETDTVARVTAYGQTILYVGLTVICCIMLLMHVRFAAYLTTILVAPVFCGYLLWRGSLIETAISINLAIVYVAMVYVATIFARDFRATINSRTEITKMHEHEKALAATDSLTGLHNRRHFYKCLEDAAASDDGFCVLMVDLDGFKQVNDVYGHSVGDTLLRDTGNRLKWAAEGAMSTARIGGDEFAVLLPLLSEQELVETGNRIIDACRQPFVSDGVVIAIGASVGVDLAKPGEVGVPADVHVQRADFALLDVKQRGGGCATVFAPSHEAAVKRTSLVEQAVRRAVLEDEMSVVYQPIVSAATWQVTSFEALVRWRSPELGQVSPSEFIPIAERCGRIQAITRLVLERSLSQLPVWPDSVRLKINLSAHDLASCEQVSLLLAALEDRQGIGSRLTFEITETAFNQNQDSLREALARLRSVGASIAVDDFGTGYSSLSAVHTIRPDLIKIDKSFVDRVDDKGDGLAMTRTIVEMSRALGARSLAEGVENERQARILVDIGCEELQGYWFSRPLPEQDARSFAERATGASRLRHRSG